MSLVDSRAIKIVERNPCKWYVIKAKLRGTVLIPQAQDSRTGCEGILKHQLLKPVITGVSAADSSGINRAPTLVPKIGEAGRGRERKGAR